MKKNIRGKIKQFLESEEGRVSAKAPLTLGVATGSVLLAQAMIPSLAQAELVFDRSGVTCEDHNGCSAEIGEICDFDFNEDNLPTIIVTSKCIIPDD